MTRRRPRLPALLGLVLAAAAQAQDPQAEAFAEAWRQCARVEWTTAEREAACGRALELFLRIEDPASRRRHSAEAALAAAGAGKHELVVELALAARAAGTTAPGLLAAELKAFSRLGRLPEFVAAGRAVEGTDLGWGELAAVLRAEEGRLLPLADGALRAGATEDALWLFAALARAWPGDGIRLANLALTYRHLGRRTPALETYRQAMAAAPSDDQIRSDFGLFLRAVGNWEGAVAELQQALASEQVPGSGPAVTNLVQMEVLRPGTVQPDPLPVASRALSIRPDAAFLRRVTLDLIVARSALPSPDKAPAGR